jgi:MFS transporter, MHS family, alpha-ketoglutarate permease
MSEIAASDQVAHRSSATILGGAFGNLIEWYDWTVYGLLSAAFAAQFFPSGNQTASLLAVLATFALGFLMRPVGAILLSPYADRHGRRRMLALCITLMGLGSLVVAILPPYRLIGLAAPLILLLARLMQGFSAGGEFQGSSVFLVEHSPLHRRALASSSQMISIGLAILIATGVSALTTRYIPRPALDLWGWRIPFFIGALGAVYGLWLRLGLPETPHFEAIERRQALSRHPLLDAIREFPKETLFVFVLQMGTVQFYTWTVFLPSYAHLAAGLPLAAGLGASTIAMAIYCVAVPTFAALSDRIGRKPLLYGSVGGFLLFSFPLINTLNHASFGSFLLVAVIGILFIAMSNAVLAPVLCEAFPTRLRTSGIGLPYAICSAIFGGTAPLIATAFIKAHIDWGMPAYITAICAISIIVFATVPETRGKPLD